MVKQFGTEIVSKSGEFKVNVEVSGELLVILPIKEII